MSFYLLLLFLVQHLWWKDEDKVQNRTGTTGFLHINIMDRFAYTIYIDTSLASYKYGYNNDHLYIIEEC